MRRIASMLLAIILVLSLAACGSKQSDGGGGGGETESAEGGESSGEGKIGLMVGTVAISEEEYRSAEAWQQELGEDKVVIQTYPDNFMSEEETTISNMLSLVSDPDIKVVIFLQGVPGASVWCRSSSPLHSWKKTMGRKGQALSLTTARISCLEALRPIRKARRSYQRR